YSRAAVQTSPNSHSPSRGGLHCSRQTPPVTEYSCLLRNRSPAPGLTTIIVLYSAANSQGWVGGKGGGGEGGWEKALRGKSISAWNRRRSPARKACVVTESIVSPGCFGWLHGSHRNQDGGGKGEQEKEKGIEGE
ncbi:hypothetical protein RRG08_020775, partial [Elysia crispata]